MLRKDKKGLTGNIMGLVMGVISAIIGVVVIAYVAGALLPTAQTAITNVSGSGAPLASTLFGASGVLVIIMVIAIFLGILAIVFGMVKHKK